jgi:hypothetical protein
MTVRISQFGGALAELEFVDKPVRRRVVAVEYRRELTDLAFGHLERALEHRSPSECDGASATERRRDWVYVPVLTEGQWNLRHVPEILPPIVTRGPLHAILPDLVQL